MNLSDSDKRCYRNETKEKKPSKKKGVDPADNKNTFYLSVSFLQFGEDTDLFDLLRENRNYERILQAAAEYDSGDAPDLTHIYKSPIQNRGDDLLIENDHYAVVYNNQVGGTYEILRKVTEEDVRHNINRYGLPSDATEDVKSLINQTECPFQGLKHETLALDTSNLSFGGAMKLE